MRSKTLFRRLVDSNSLAALGYSEYADHVFTSVGMTVTANCFKELRAGKDDYSNQYAYRTGAKVAYQYLNDSEQYENLTLYPAPGSPPYVENNAGEKSIRIALFEEADSFDTVVTYDDDMGPILRPVRRAGIEYDVTPANEPLFFLYEKGKLAQQEYCTATKDVIERQGWKHSENVDTFWKFPVDCRPFR